MVEPVEYIAFGAGPPSLALAILNAWGEITPRAEFAVFADTGGEKVKTYELLPQYEAWLAEYDIELVTAYSRDGPLADYVRDKSLPIPFNGLRGQGKRQCTDKWKIHTCRLEVQRRFGKGRPMIAQLGLTYDEVHRMKDPAVKRDRNRWPLIEKRLRRDMCVEIIRTAGLPVPPESACYFCPLQNDHRWRRVAAESPQDFARAVDLDEFIRERNVQAKGEPIFLSDKRQPLRTLYSPDQMTFFGNDAGVADCESGYCFT